MEDYAIEVGDGLVDTDRRGTCDAISFRRGS